eukprot:COSAG06_NODE_71570_length_182_cov_32.518072_1_plen_40_part_10
MSSEIARWLGVAGGGGGGMTGGGGVPDLALRVRRRGCEAA